MSQATWSITGPRGFLAAAGTCGIKASGRPDLAMIVSETPAKAAAVFTRNAVVGAPVTVGREHVRGGRGRAILVNSGVANVANGERGLRDARTMCEVAAEAIGCRAADVLPHSTGVIGEPLPMDRITPGLRELAGRLDRGPAVDLAVAEAMLTTDLTTKQAGRELRLNGKRVRIGGVAKGSGMIAPNMATMLAFLTTDAELAAGVLRRALREAVDADGSFNRLTVDSDTSTSDTVAILANGAAETGPIREAGGGDYEAVAAALVEVCRDLSYQIVADGEGVQHVIRVRVQGAASAADAERIARSVADSPLVKTAVHGGDPNWGRLAMAVGKAKAKIDPARLSLAIGSQTVMRRGEPRPFDRPAAARCMQQPEVTLHVDLALGEHACEVLGADLSRKYIEINADYHT